MIVLNMPEFLDDKSLDQIKGGACGCKSCNHSNCNTNETTPSRPGDKGQSYSISIS